LRQSDAAKDKVEVLVPQVKLLVPGYADLTLKWNAYAEVRVASQHILQEVNRTKVAEGKR